MFSVALPLVFLQQCTSCGRIGTERLRLLARATLIHLRVFSALGAEVHGIGHRLAFVDVCTRCMRIGTEWLPVVALTTLLQCCKLLVVALVGGALGAIMMPVANLLPD